MPSTTPDALPYPSLTDAPNGPTAIQSLATATQAALSKRAEKWGTDTHGDVLGASTSGAFFTLTTITVSGPCRVFLEADTYATISAGGANWSRNFRIGATLVAQPAGQVMALSGWQRSQGVIDLAAAGTFTVEGRNEQGAGGTGGATVGVSQWRIRVASILT